MKMKLSSFSTALALAVIAITAVPSRLSGEGLTALGRVLPRSGIVDVNGIQGDTIVSLNVKEGDWVEAGQSLATLSSEKASLQAVKDAETDLANLKANNARDHELAEQRLSEAEFESKIAEDRYNRIKGAKNTDFISPDQVEDRSTAKAQAALKVVQSREDLVKSSQDADKAVRGAEAALNAAKAQLALSRVISPIRAKVLKIRSRAGSTVGRTEIMKLGDTSTMIVTTEIYEADVLKVKVGQKATISSAALPTKMTGSIVGISNMIYRNSLESIDPNDNATTRIVEVTVQMKDSAPLDRLVLLQVDVNIEL
jgi:HlyD family secretion protein